MNLIKVMFQQFFEGISKKNDARNFVAFCENNFCRNLKINKVKVYVKVYIFRKEIVQDNSRHYL